MTDRQAGPAGLFERRLRPLLPGVLIAGIIALASQFVAEHYGAPAMLLALLFGISLNFLGTEAQSKPGIDFGSRQLLRLGVALLGVRISADVLTLLGWPVVLMIVGAVVATIGFGLAVSRLFGFRFRFAFCRPGRWRSAAPRPPWPSQRSCRATRARRSG